MIGTRSEPPLINSHAARRIARKIAWAILCLFGCGTASAAVAATQPGDPAELRRLSADLLIVGGTESGWAAAIQAARMGVASIVIVHDGRWLGGQFTEQALACVDENKGVGKVGWGVAWHPMKRAFHRSGLFKELMDRIEAHNAAVYGSAMPGRPYHGPSTFRPAEAEAVFRSMLQPYIDSGQVTLITDRYPVRADVQQQANHPQLTGLWFAPVETSHAPAEPPDPSAAAGPGHAADLHVRARLTIDASDWGEAIQLSGAALQCGPDPRDRFLEPSAPIDLSHNPGNEMNAITWAMIVEQSDQPRPIPQPSRYDERHFVRATRLSLEAMSDLKWDRPVRLSSIAHWPDRDQQSPRQLSVYTVRRLIEGSTSRQGRTVILLNYMLGQDYPLERLPQHVVDALEATQPGASQKNIVTMTRRQRQIIFDDAKRHSLCLLYHLQTFVHQRAADTSNSFRNFQLSDEFGTPDRLPPKPYIRESLRLQALYMMREQDCRNNDGQTKQHARERLARVLYPDGVGCWQFHYDFHHTGRAFLETEGPQGPWIDYEKPGRHTRHVSDRAVFPLRSLIPEHMDGLLGAQKNIGCSSIVSAAIRLHDQCIAIGQAAGAAAAVALRDDVPPRMIPFDRHRLEQVREGLCGQSVPGVPLLIWPLRDLSPDQDSYVAINRLAARGMLPSDVREVDFHADRPADAYWRRQVMHLTAAELDGVELPQLAETETISRGQFCQRWWSAVGQLPLRPFPRQLPNDADRDGVLDADDPLPFTPTGPVVWSIAAAPPDRDGLIDERLVAANGLRAFDFGDGQAAPASIRFVADDGAVFDPQRGFGWDRNLRDHHRRRGVYAEDYRDTFLFTRDAASWKCAVDKGSWSVTVCIGDAGHDQPGQQVRVQGRPLFANEDTAAGQFHEKTIVVQVPDGLLSVELGPQQPGKNTCLNWIALVPID